MEPGVQPERGSPSRTFTELWSLLPGRRLRPGAHSGGRAIRRQPKRDARAADDRRRARRAGGRSFGGALFLWNRRRREREIEEQRQLAEREFAELTERMDEFGEKERLVAGYLEAQRPLLDQRCEEEVETRIRDARSAGFGREFNEAASHLASDPRLAREKIARRTRPPRRRPRGAGRGGVHHRQLPRRRRGPRGQAARGRR